jgi:apolipoprotein D and lipocalin family protein
MWLLPLLAGCVRVPHGIEPVAEFALNRYLGKWYEIARLDHSFERGLECVTADYSLRADGGVSVVNRGYNADRDAWSQAEGRAYLVRDAATGHLKVSFFGPFYASYVIFELDHDDYQYAFVTSSTRSYLWLLARTPTVSDALRARFIDRVRELGFAADELIWVAQAPAAFNPG